MLRLIGAGRFSEVESDEVPAISRVLLSSALFLARRVGVPHGQPQTEVLTMTLCNYVVFFPDAHRIKFGITSNLKKRVHQYKQEALRHGLGSVTFTRIHADSNGLVKASEIELRRALRRAAIKGHYEWMEGDFDTYQEIVCATRRIHSQFYETGLFGKSPT